MKLKFLLFVGWVNPERQAFDYVNVRYSSVCKLD